MWSPLLMKGSALNDGPKPHRNWQRSVDLAYFRLLGWTQKEAAAAVGIDQRTIREYEPAVGIDSPFHRPN